MQPCIAVQSAQQASALSASGEPSAMPASAMPTFRVVKSVTEEPTSRKRRLAEANFVLIYNKKLFAKGEAEGGFEELEELVAEEAEENAVATHNTTSNKRRRR